MEWKDFIQAESANVGENCNEYSLTSFLSFFCLHFSRQYQELLTKAAPAPGWFTGFGSLSAILGFPRQSKAKCRFQIPPSHMTTKSKKNQWLTLEPEITRNDAEGRRNSSAHSLCSSMPPNMSGNDIRASFFVALGLSRWTQFSISMRIHLVPPSNLGSLWTRHTF